MNPNIATHLDESLTSQNTTQDTNAQESSQPTSITFTSFPEFEISGRFSESDAMQNSQSPPLTTSTPSILSESGNRNTISQVSQSPTSEDVHISAPTVSKRISSMTLDNNNNNNNNENTSSLSFETETNQKQPYTTIAVATAATAATISTDIDIDSTLPAEMLLTQQKDREDWILAAYAKAKSRRERYHLRIRYPEFIDLMEKISAERRREERRRRWEEAVLAIYRRAEGDEGFRLGLRGRYPELREQMQELEEEIEEMKKGEEKRKGEGERDRRVGMMVDFVGEGLSGGDGDDVDDVTKIEARLRSREVRDLMREEYRSAEAWRRRESEMVAAREVLVGKERERERK